MDNERSCPQAGPEFSKNAVFEQVWDLRFDKSWTAAGRSMRATLEIYNLFDSHLPIRIDARTGRGFVLGDGTAGVDATNPNTILRYSDPSLYREGREIRFGIETNL